MSKISPIVKKFKGIYNKMDSMSLNWQYLKEADNVDISNDGRIVTRSGYQKVSEGDFHSAFTTRDRKRMFAVKDGFLCHVINEPMVEFRQIIKAAGNVFYAQQNDDIFVTDGVFFGYINKANLYFPLDVEAPLGVHLKAVDGTLEEGLYQVVCTRSLPDGRESGAIHTASIDIKSGQGLLIESIADHPDGDVFVYIAPANSQVFQLAYINPGPSVIWNGTAQDLGIELATFNKHTLPKQCSYMTFHKGCLYAVYNDKLSSSCAVFYSNPLQPHLFSLESDFISVDGDCTALFSTDSHLGIGTEKSIYSWNGESLNQESDFGAIHGSSCIKDTVANNTSRVLLWTQRGLCSAFPVQMLTDTSLSVEKASFAHGVILEKNGEKRYIVSTINEGEPDNKYTGD